MEIQQNLNNSLQETLICSRENHVLPHPLGRYYVTSRRRLLCEPSSEEEENELCLFFAMTFVYSLHLCGFNILSFLCFFPTVNFQVKA